MKTAAPAETEEFLDALTAINLRRIWILTLVGQGLALAVFFADLAVAGWSTMTKVAVGDVVFTALTLAAVALIQRRPRRGRWPRLFVAGYALAWLASLDAYYFSAFAAGTHNASYAIGAIGATVFFLLPPRIFFPLLALNHAFYCGRLLLLAHVGGRKVAAPLIDGTVCVAIAGLASWFLYHAARENFFKTRALAKSNDELREVMAIAAHDLRSPLLDVRNLLSLARREPGAAQGALPRMLTLATDACGAMVRLVSRLVEAHEAEAGGTLTLAPLDAREACRAVAERLRPSADVKRQRLALTLPDAPAFVRADAGALDRVLENLAGNALKFSPAGATVEIVLVATAHGAWRIDVHDDGPGVPEAERAQLWQKFHRGSARPTNGEASTGLGLFIVKTLSDAMGGRVSYVAREPRGSVFRVELSATR